MQQALDLLKEDDRTAKRSEQNGPRPASPFFSPFPHPPDGHTAVVV
jgi:hypothetical protein